MASTNVLLGVNAIFETKINFCLNKRWNYKARCDPIAGELTRDIPNVNAFWKYGSNREKQDLQLCSPTAQRFIFWKGKFRIGYRSFTLILTSVGTSDLLLVGRRWIQIPSTHPGACCTVGTLHNLQRPDDDDEERNRARSRQKERWRNLRERFVKFSDGNILRTKERLMQMVVHPTQCSCILAISCFVCNTILNNLKFLIYLTKCARIYYMVHPVIILIYLILRLNNILLS